MSYLAALSTNSGGTSSQKQSSSHQRSAVTSKTNGPRSVVQNRQSWYDFGLNDLYFPIVHEHYAAMSRAEMITRLDRFLAVVSLPVEWKIFLSAFKNNVDSPIDSSLMYRSDKHNRDVVTTFKLTALAIGDLLLLPNTGVCYNNLPSNTLGSEKRYDPFIIVNEQQSSGAISQVFHYSYDVMYHSIDVSMEIKAFTSYMTRNLYKLLDGVIDAGQKLTNFEFSLRTMLNGYKHWRFHKNSEAGVSILLCNLVMFLCYRHCSNSNKDKIIKQILTPGRKRRRERLITSMSQNPQNPTEEEKERVDRIVSEHYDKRKSLDKTVSGPLASINERIFVPILIDEQGNEIDIQIANCRYQLTEIPLVCRQLASNLDTLVADYRDDYVLF